MLLLLVSAHIIFLFTSPSFAAEKVLTKIIVRVVAKDSKVIGSGVGGAFVRIRNLETGEILVQGKQEGGTGQLRENHGSAPAKRGDDIWDFRGGLFPGRIPLDRPTRAEIYTEAPLAYPHAIQKGLKTLTLIPGKDILAGGHYRTGWIDC